MHSAAESIRPVPRWVHIWAIATVVATAILLTLGSIVTSFRVGMSDPIWPTEPWFLFVNGFVEPRQGFLIEHVHRLMGFIVGGFASILAIGLCLSEPRKSTRWIGVAAVIALIVTFGGFHGQMMKQRDLSEAIVWPRSTIVAMAIFASILLLNGITGIQQRIPASGLRLLGLFALIGVMIQGLLGGFRVRLDAMFGTDLAAIHGIFAQVVFTMLVSIAMLSARRNRTTDVPGDERSRLSMWTIALMGTVFLQLVWGAMVRHHGTPVMQRLHFLTAFIVLGLAIWLIRTFTNSISWARVGFTAKLLVGVLAFQILLGVEAWMGKFYMTMTPDLDMVTTGKALVRCLHVLTGTSVLVLSTVLLILLQRRSTRVIPASEGFEASARDSKLGALPVGGR